MGAMENKDQSLLTRTAVIEMILSGTWVQDHLSEALKPYKLSIAQFNVLRILRGQKGKPASLACVNDKMIHKMSNTTRLVDKLLKKGLVDRIICPNNRRMIELTITSEGLELLKELDVVIDKTEEQLMSNLTPNEVNALVELLQKLKE
ncbi:DNA-binding transcriptional regulator, MarR family [Salinimicrobium catena]|uniref:DNA-binding transcriptional regulator, MarR family n=2 Tax=Salinimicrobium catena TaxID=390640 RepID=A0A1H5KXM1_9FLAO|nr:DNA-binding transcriptional regulator, MarR family [Salinimicrobium catena]SEE69609.1 DNA-binding transcriptional regulator, MarR family [Salinimicrobium catena]